MFDLRWRRLCAGLLVACCALAGPLACQGQPVDSGDQNLEVEQAVEKALARIVSVDFRGMALSDAVNTIGQACGIEFMLDHNAMEEAGIAEDTAVSIAIHGNTGGAALAAVLRPLELTWLVRDGQAMITTVSNAETVVELRVYPVQDVILARDEKGTYADFESLIDVVTSTVAPTTWTDVGGQGSIKPFFNSQSIVVMQTREVHREVEVLLAGLRRARDVQGLGHFAHSESRTPLSYAPPAVPLSAAASVPATLRPASTSPPSRLVRVYE